MNVCERHHFNPAVDAWELGYGPIGRPIMTVYCYFVDDLLIDTGQAHMRSRMLDIVKTHSARRILLTHHHEDHSGNAAAICKLSEAQVMGHPLAKQKMAVIGKILPYQHIVWGQTQAVPVNILPQIIETERFRFAPIHTPGHSKDHTVYLEERMGWLFSGDLYLGDRIKFFRSDENIGLQVQSLKMVLKYDFESIFCAHNPVLQKGREKLQRKLEYLEYILESVKAYMEKGLPEKEIIRKLDRKQDRFVRFFTFGDASFSNMIRSALRALEFHDPASGVR